MSSTAIISFALAMLILAASPGPGVMATIARALSCGLRPALVLISGIILADIIFLLFAIFGLSVLAQSLGHFFIIIKILGGGYLIWQGIKIFFAHVDADEQRIKTAATGYGNFFSGLFITLANPKVILFYCGFLPTFISLTELTALDITIVASVVATVLSAVLGCYAWLATSARHLLRSPRRRRVLNRAAGTVMATAGVVIASRS